MLKDLERYDVIDNDSPFGGSVSEEPCSDGAHVSAYAHLLYARESKMIINKLIAVCEDVKIHLSVQQTELVDVLLKNIKEYME